jgi:diacylglycerol kinase family enzyme
MSNTTCVIYNPVAGRGRAEKLFKKLSPDLTQGVTLLPTQKEGHGVEIARTAATNGVARVIAAGGDGTVHEVANGILQSGRTDVVFSIWPIGSANDFAYSLGLSEWWRRREEKLPTRVMDVDVAQVTAAGRQVFAVDSVGVGFNGMVTLEARKCHWLAGMPLYGWAFLKAMVKHFKKPRMRIAFDGRQVELRTLALSLLNGQREGNFPLRPQAVLDDGYLDYMHATDLSRWHLVRYLPAMATGRLPEGHPLLHLGKARRVEVESESPLCVHADGEFVCRPEEGVTSIRVEVLEKKLKVEVFEPALYGGSASSK